MGRDSFSRSGAEGLGRRALEGGRILTGKRDRGRRGYPGLLAEQNTQGKEGASTGRSEEIGPILVLSSSYRPELATPWSCVSAAALAAGLQMRENVRRLFSNFFPSPSLPCAQSGVEN